MTVRSARGRVPPTFEHEPDDRVTLAYAEKHGDERGMVEVTLGRPYTWWWRLVHCDRCPTRDDAGGYSFWRCRRLRFHPGAHRFRNYIWTKGMRVEYDPLAVTGSRAPGRGYSWWTGRAK